MTRPLRNELKPAKPFSTLEEDVCLEILRTSNVTGRWVAEALKPSGLTPPQFNVLRILRGARPEALASCRIGERMINHDPDLTRLVDRLESAGLVVKSRDADDRRVVKVRITKAGLKVVEDASQAVQLKLQAVLKPVGSRKLNTLAALLELVRGSAG